MKQLLAALAALALTCSGSAADLPAGVDPADPLLQLGCLDVTKPPYRADPSGRTQHYWDLSHRIVLFGSTAGKRPVLKLAPHGKGFDDPAKPKVLVWIWAQTRNDAPGKQEPNWGEEQPNISFSHFFRGIDLDIRGHAGAIGIRHAGSQGSSMFDSTILADGAYAGMANCCGQGGGTDNIEVIGGRHAIVIDRTSRFPILTGCVFKGQSDAAIAFSTTTQVPTMLVGCVIESSGSSAIDLTTQSSYAGLNLIDCAIRLNPGGVLVRTRQSENIFLENTFVHGPTAIQSGGARLPAPGGSTHIARYSSHLEGAVNLLNGHKSTGEVRDWAPASSSPDFAAVRARTQLFGLTGTFSSIGSGDTYRGGGKTSPGAKGRGAQRGPAAAEGPACTLATPDDPAAAPGLSLLSVRGRVDWRSGQGTLFLARSTLALSGHAGGRFYGVMGMGRPFVLSGLTQPTSFYSLNVERVFANPQSEFKDCAHLRIFYFKVEAGTVGGGNAGDANTPGRIARCRDVHVYGMVGNVKSLGDRPMLDIVDSAAVVVSQLKAFQSSTFPHLIEQQGSARSSVPSSQPVALFARD